MTTNEIAVRGQDSTPAPRPSSVPTLPPEFVKPRLPEVGRIRLGEKRVKGGKTYPAKLESFRFTSPNKAPLEAVAEVYGGAVVPWDSDEGKQWQVTTMTSSVQVIVPKAELAFSQYFELWAGGGLCERRCDGYTELRSGVPCLCDHRPGMRDCQKTTRLSVFLKGIPGMGLWRVESHGNTAASEILGMIQVGMLYDSPLLPGVLTLANRGPRRILDPKDPDKTITVRYVVPVLTWDFSIEDLAARQMQLADRRLGIGPSSYDRASEQSMRALRATVFGLWPNSVIEPERSVRLGQLSRMLGRQVDTIGKEHDLTEAEVAHLLDALGELSQELEDSETASVRHPGPEAEAGPVSPEASGSADSSAGDVVKEPPHQMEESRPSEVAGRSPAEPHSVGTEPHGRKPGGRSGTAATGLAEHHSDEGPPPDSEAAAETAEPTSASSKGTSRKPAAATRDMPGAAAAPARPKRVPRPGKPNIPEAQREAMATRRQTEVVHKPARWIHTLNVEWRNRLLQAAANWMQPHNHVQDVMARVAPIYGKSLEGWTDDMEWTSDQLEALLQETEAGSP